MMIGEAPMSVVSKCVGVSFEERLRAAGLWPITALRPAVMQMNLGYRCNQCCAHCHIEAGPDRVEEMPWGIMQAALAFASAGGISEFDLTGGAPELNPRFKRLVRCIVQQGGTVTDRCNLSVLGEPGQEDLAGFLATHGVRVMASLPHYSREVTDRVRGAGAFERAVAGLRALNAAGYGQPDTTLELVLVTNPAGAFVTASQASLEADFRTHLSDGFGITFTRLITLTNMPIGRFLRFLVKSGNLAGYMRRLEAGFNPATAPSVMCRSTLSLGWDGRLYDCDFNQVLGLGIDTGDSVTIETVTADDITGRAVRCADHCYGCTAGAGSSCGGAVAE
jgi:radical SAM/Cys-rich protein